VSSADRDARADRRLAVTLNRFTQARSR